MHHSPIVPSDMMIFSGNAHPTLAKEIIDKLRNNGVLDVRLGRAIVGQFSDGEVKVEIEEHVRGKDVFVIQPTSTPTNDNLMELLVMIDALRLSSARRITAVIPYYGYARQDRRPRAMRVPISARLTAKMLATAGADRILTMDLHADQIQGFFDVPVDNVYSSPKLLEDIWHQNYENQIIVSPDVGGVVRARSLAKRLGDADLAFIDKRRPEANVAQVMNIIGDVKGRDCILIDDLVDTAGTLCKAAEALKEQGATKVVAYCTHPVLSGSAVKNIENSKLDELVVTNTIPLQEHAEKCTRIRQLSVAGLFSETILRINNEESVSELFMD